MRRIVGIIGVFVLLATLAYAQSKEAERLGKCATVMEEILNAPDNIPQELLDKAECVGVFPSVKKVALGFGGNFGAGAFVCRSGEKFNGAWGAPAMYRLEGASVGLQLGGSATDFILLVMNTKGVDAIIKSKAKLGGDASVAGGPKGRSADAATDVTMRAEVLTYSRARGAFAGVSLEGSTLRPDGDANKKIYGKEIEARVILREGVSTPAAGQPLATLLNKRTPKNLSK